MGGRSGTNQPHKRTKKKTLEMPEGSSVFFFLQKLEKETEKTEQYVDKQIESKLVNRKQRNGVNCLFCNCRAFCICMWTIGIYYIGDNP